MAEFVREDAAEKLEPVRPWIRRSRVWFGAAAANSLGLTMQVPVREVHLTAGPTRKLTLGRQVVELRPAPAWQLALPGR